MIVVRLVVGMTGASGVQYGLRLIETLVRLDHEVDLVVSEGARKVLYYEVKSDYDAILESVQHTYDIRDIGAAIASGTHPNQGMVIVPCSMKTLAAIANGFSQNLIHRAADCMLKENKPLVLVNRETPLSLVHLRNMVKAKEAGATILPASPGLYKDPKSISDLIDFIVAKILNVMKIDHDLMKPWDPTKKK